MEDNKKIKSLKLSVGKIGPLTFNKGGRPKYECINELRKYIMKLKKRVKVLVLIVLVEFIVISMTMLYMAHNHIGF